MTNSERLAEVQSNNGPLKLYVTVGLPRSGKTTWARAQGVPIVNPDAIRFALHGQRYYAPAEPWVWSMAYLMVSSLRLAGHDQIVVDATNVTAKRRKEWEDRYPGMVYFHAVEASPELCVKRAMERNDTEIIPVIERMALEWDWLCPFCQEPTKAGEAFCPQHHLLVNPGLPSDYDPRVNP